MVEKTSLESLELQDSLYGERNKQPILDILQEYLQADTDVLEIGSGTGQHAVFFSRQLASIHWQMTEMAENLEVLKARHLQQGNERMPEPCAIDSRDSSWDLPRHYDAAFSANTAHIMSWQGVCGLLHGVGKALKPGGLFLLYGPFRYHGEDTSPSNSDFHRLLKSRSPEMGIRDYYELEALAAMAGLCLWKDMPMPANNRILIFKNG
ncbi:MAG: DUF938 domain-containing protein [Proteobacteria bacterium]|nr:DUF938 domain-containing protein [Pseudomonadota bacterium]